MTTGFIPEIASFLLKSNSLQFGIFKLASGKESPYYIDLRTIASFPSHFRLTIGALRDAIMAKIGLDFDYLASVPTSGLIFCSALAYEIVKPLVYVRKEAKGYGVSKIIEGYLKPGAKVVLIDDVVTTGKSLSHAIEIIRSNGAIVEEVLAIVDRLEGAEQSLKMINVKLRSVTTIEELLNALNKQGLIDDNTLHSVFKNITQL
jgi:orotate phosphoribosyltransferase